MQLERWRTQHPLEGPFLKMQRAEKHLESIDEYLVKFDELNPHRMACVLDAEKAFYEYHLVALFPPFLDFGIALGEFCYQVRFTLDHIIHALAVFPDDAREKARAERDTSFPISLLPNDTFIDGRLKWIPDHIRPDVRTIVEEVQPYQRGDRDAALTEPLALLEELCLIDKHRVFRSPEVELHIDLTNLAPGIRTASTGRVGHGEVFAYVPSALDPHVEFDPRVTAEVVLPKVWPDKASPRMDSLGIIHNRVRNTILPRFVRFLEPLPPSIQI